jgi:hypothetical protein
MTVYLFFEAVVERESETLPWGREAVITEVVVPCEMKSVPRRLEIKVDKDLMKADLPEEDCPTITVKGDSSSDTD